MTREEALKKVLEKYKISMPLDKTVRKQIMKSRKEVLVNIFKHYGQYNIIMAAALVFYYPLRRIGISVTLAQSAVITFAVSAIAVISILTGGYFTIKKLMFIPPAEKQLTRELINLHENKPQLKQNIQIDKFENKIIFQGFKSSSADKTIVNNLNAEILKELYLIRGQGNVLFAPAKTGGILIVCSLEKLDNTYLISIKAVNMETSQILIIKEDSGLLSEITAKSVKMMKEIIATIK